MTRAVGVDADRSTGPAGPAGDDERDAAAAIARATGLLRQARELEPASAHRRAQRLSRLLDDPASMAFSLALTDEVARIAEPARAARRLRDLVHDHGTPGFLGPLDRVLLRAGVAVGRVAPSVVARAVAARLRHESAGVVLPAEDPAFGRYVAHRRDAGIRLNVNVLGEAILGDDEARRRLDEVLARVDRPDVDYVSVKVSSVCAQLSSLAFDRSVARIAERLRVLYRRAAAASPPVFVNLDMEEFRDLELTLAVFRAVLDEPDLAGLDAGIVLQAYLPDAHGAFEELARWARDRHDRAGGRVKVRLVKGANLAMERVDAELHGWAPAPYGTKAEVDASYKRLLDRALDPAWGPGVRVGLASHNLFDVAWGLVRAEALGSRDRLELEMLEGMAPGEAEAVRRAADGILLYAPVVRDDEYDAAIAYLVRRLDENTGPENFLRHLFAMTPGSPVFEDQRERFERAVAARHHLDTASRRDQDRATEDRCFSLDDPFVNEPDTDWTRETNRRWIASHLAAVEGARPDVPIVLAGRRIEAADAPSVADAIDPSHPEMTLHRFARADRAVVDEAVAASAAAVDSWSGRPTRERAELLVRAAEVIASRRGEAIATMVRDAGKVVAEADVEVSEAIDLAAYYGREALRLDTIDARHAPLGPVVVTPPWNFPFAIPAGGVLAALAAGNPVVLKPAPETVLTAWVLATCLWDAGIPTDALQFVPCPDDDVGRRLVTHPDVAAVILTGALDTARLFRSWRPDLRLHAETSGKNAIVVTATADLDLAVKDLVRSAFGHAGQKCSAASLAIVEQSVLDDGRFLAKLADATRTLAVGPAEDPATDVGPLIRPPEGVLRRALTELDPGERWLVRPHAVDDHGHLWTPGIRTGVAPGSFLHLTECFGPVLGVLAARDLDHALELQDAVAFGLTGGLHSLDPAEVDRWLARVAVGNAYVNRSTTGAIVRRQPFGGWKASVVGPAAKAGGPGYVLSLARWTDGDPGAPHDDAWLARARASDEAAWARLGAPTDPSGLRAERNELRHVPRPRVVLRVEPGAPHVDVVRGLAAAATVGTPVLVSDAAHETLDELLARLRRERPERVRVLGPVPPQLWAAAAELDVTVDDAVPVEAGEVELRRWCREQAVSTTTHRHGNVVPRP